MNDAEIWVIILMHPQPQMHVKNPLSGNINMEVRMNKVLFKFRRHFCKVSIEIGPQLCRVIEALGVALWSMWFD